MIDSWVDWAVQFDKPTEQLVYPILGIRAHDKQAAQQALASFGRSLDALDTHLDGRTYLVGERVTLADVAVVSHILCLYMVVSWL